MVRGLIVCWVGLGRILLGDLELLGDEVLLGLDLLR